MRLAHFLAVLLFNFTLAPAQAIAYEFLDVAQAFKGSASVADEHTVALRLEVAPAYHLYRERMAVTAVGGTAPALGPVDFPRGKVQFDENFSKNVELLQGVVAIRVPVVANEGPLRLQVRYQGCADEGLCYPPQTASVAVDLAQGRIRQVRWANEDETPTVMTDAPRAAAVAASAASVIPEGDGERIERALRSGSLFSIAVVFLLAGLLLSFTPCVLPMVPILSSIIVGQGVPVSRSRGFTLALAYALGMALVYTGFGVMAGLAGEGLAAALQNPWVLGGFALTLAALSLSMFGVFELQMPGFIQTHLSQASTKMPGGRFLGVFVMGGLSALVVGPCVAAPLAGALVFISQTRDVAIGGLALFSLAMGMSVPLLLVGLSAGSLLPRTGGWMNHVKTFFGLLLLAVALWLVSPVLPAWVLMLIIGAALLMGAVYLKLFDRIAGERSGRHRFAQGLGLVLAVLGAAQVVGALSGGSDPLQPLGHLARRGDATVPIAATPARASFTRVRNTAELDQVLQTVGRPVMLDFYADWCVACKEMEHLTFHDPAIAARLSGAVLLQADVTANNADDKALMKRFGLFGPPGILFFDPQGREQSTARVVGYEPPERFAVTLGRVGL